ncbi:hypothetical protein QUF55_10440, partial [Clostridiaceae bacterium HSG29]|nr:hypothetical protein [Clostridiaceae bacterium HSG29]
SVSDIWGLYKRILFFVTVGSLIGLFANIIKNSDKDLKKILLFKVLLFTLILRGLTFLGVFYIGGVHTFIIAIIYIAIFSKKVLLS